LNNEVFTGKRISNAATAPGVSIMKLSIAMCTHNGAAYLHEQLESLAAQTHLPDELIICDDRSSDGLTLKIIDEFARRAAFPVRFFVNEKNLGSKKNFEKAIRLCSEEVICLCDQDDFWLPNKLSRIEQAFISSPDAGLVFSDAEVVDEELQPMGASLWELGGFGPEKQESFRREGAFHSLLRGNVVTGTTMAFRSRFRDVVLSIPETAVLQHDGWIALTVSAVSDFVLIEEPLIKYRQHATQQIGACIPLRGSENPRRDSPLLKSISKIPSQAGQLDACKAVYARLVTKCHGLVGTENLADIKGWILRLENERTVLANNDAPAEKKRTWIKLRKYLDNRKIRVAHYILQDLFKFSERLTLRDIRNAAKCLLLDTLYGINFGDVRKDYFY
jgi:glycosyltransferase involved in cell wall biosynthesis